MTSPDPAPLTAEEQALAQRLARLEPHAEPSPALDARVLAAAHAATSALVTTLPRRRRWPAALGLAASLVLAVGLAWRLRPLPEPPPAPRAAADAGNSAAPVAPAAMEAAKPSVAPAPEPDLAGEARREVAAPVTPVPPPKPAAVVESPSPLRAAPLERRSSAKVSATAATSVPPSPPPPPETLRDAAADVTAPAPAAPPATEAIAPQSAASANEAEQAATAGDNRQADEPTDEVPPATVDSPAVRDAWLQRIHRLVDAGDITGARASLREFARRYPDYPLPEDLRALEQ